MEAQLGERCPRQIGPWEGLRPTHGAERGFQLAADACDELSRRLLEPSRRQFLGRGLPIGEQVELRHRRLLALHFNLWCN
jgi:hypothetical protein